MPFGEIQLQVLSEHYGLGTRRARALVEILQQFDGTQTLVSRQ